MAKISLCLCFLLGLLVLSQAHGGNIKKVKAHGGDKKKIGFYELQKGDFKLNLTNYGAAIISFLVPDKHGKLADVVLGYDSIKQYKNDTVYFGSLVGRVANRIGGAKFSLDGKTYKLPANDHGNTLHGGKKGFTDVVWKVKSYRKNSHIMFEYESHDKEQGFPGKLDVSVTYRFVGHNSFGVKMIAKPINKATPVNLAQHTYWNLRGHNSGDILSHTVQIFGSKITPVDDKLIPTGKFQSVKGTPFDFLKPKKVGTHLDKLPGLYDINYVLDKASNKKHLRKVVVVVDPVSGRKMELFSNQVGLQYYTSGMLGDIKGKNGATYHKFAGIVLETQGFPDSVNHPTFPSQIVRPGQTYTHEMLYKFSTS